MKKDFIYEKRLHKDLGRQIYGQKIIQKVKISF